jgi:hypothetical protein
MQSKTRRRFYYMWDCTTWLTVPAYLFVVPLGKGGKTFQEHSHHKVPAVQKDK